MNGVPDVTPPELPQLLEPPVTPAEADFLIAQSTMPGYISLRNGTGSFFIQSFVKHVKQHSPRYYIRFLLFCNLFFDKHAYAI